MSELTPTYESEVKKLVVLKKELTSFQEKIRRGLGDEQADRYFTLLPNLIKQAETSVKTVALAELNNTNEKEMSYIDNDTLTKYRIGLVSLARFDRKKFQSAYPELDKKFTKKVVNVRLTTSKLK